MLDEIMPALLPAEKKMPVVAEKSCQSCQKRTTLQIHPPITAARVVTGPQLLPTKVIAKAIAGLTPLTVKKIAKYETAALLCAIRMMYPTMVMLRVMMRKIPRFLVLSESQQNPSVVKKPSAKGGADRALAAALVNPSAAMICGTNHT